MYAEKSIFEKKNLLLYIDKFQSLVLPRNLVMLQHLIINIHLIIWQVFTHEKFSKIQVKSLYLELLVSNDLLKATMTTFRFKSLKCAFVFYLLYMTT